MHPIKSIIARRQTKMSKAYEKSKYGKALTALKDSHKGERCFVIGNGPSLTANDLNEIAKSGIPSFAMNRVFKIFDKTNWRPTYYVSEDILIIRDTQEEVNAIESEIKFIPANLNWYEGIDIKDALYFYMDYSSDFSETCGLSLDIPHSVRCRGTVTTTCIQLAVYMGFSEIYLLGIDNNYSKKIDLNGKIVEDKTVKDYFVDNYDADIKNEVVHDMRATENAYDMVKNLSEKVGTFKVYNATRGGKLENFERVDFDEIIKG